MSKDPRKARTRKAVLGAAGALFASGGVERTTVDEIADRAGVSVGSIYAHFGSKDRLLVEFVDERLALAMEWLTATLGAVDSPLQRVLDTGEAYVQFALLEPVAFRFIAMRALDPGPAAIEDDAGVRVSRRMATITAGVEADLAAAIERGEIDAVPTDQAMIFLLGAWNGVAGQILRHEEPISADLARAALRLGQTVLLRGLGAPAPRDAG